MALDGHKRRHYSEKFQKVYKEQGPGQTENESNVYISGNDPIGMHRPGPPRSIDQNDGGFTVRIDHR